MIVHLAAPLSNVLSPQPQRLVSLLVERPTREMGAWGFLFVPLLASPLPQLVGALHSWPNAGHLSMIGDVCEPLCNDVGDG